MFEITLNDFLEMYKLKLFGIKAVEKFNLEFPIIPNENLTRIVGWLTFDGHLSIRQHCFLFTAGDVKLLNPFIETVYQEFGVRGKMKKVETNKFGDSYEYRICNNPITKILYLLGVPSGNKVLNEFTVPKWILDNKEFSRTYLQTAFDCEGGVWREGDRVRIRFTMAKCIDRLDNGIEFIESLRDILRSFGISSTNTWVEQKNNIRKNDVITKFIRFDIKKKDVIKFKNIIGFINEDKMNKLNIGVVG